MRIFNVMAALLAVSASAQVLAETESGAGGQAAGRKFLYSSTPEGKTLPEGVYRFRAIHQTATGDQSFDKDGNKADAAVKATITGGAAVAEYGYSDKLSIQLKAPFILGQKVEVNRGSAAYAAIKSSTFSSKTGGAKNADELSAAVRAKVIANFKAAGACASDTACATAYDAGLLKTQAAGSVIDGTSSVAAGTAYKDAVPTAAAQVDAAIDAGIAAAAESTGGRGLSDVEIGALYEAYGSDSMFFSVGGGIRLPTGNRDLSGTELDLTRSAYELGLRLNFDYLPVEWFMLSWQNQSELGIAGTKRKVNGVEEAHKRDGVRNVGFFYLKPSLAVLSPSLDGIKTTLGLSYDYDSAEKVTKNSKETTSEHVQQQWMYASVGYSMLGMGIPLQFDIEHEKAYKGKHVSVAVAKTTLALKAFAKF